MKTVSLKKLKDQGWDLTPDSKKAMQEQKAHSTLSKQVEAITNLAEKVDGIKDVLRADTAKDYTLVIDKLITAIKEIKIDIPVTEQKDYRFIVKRGPDGMITEVEAVIK